MNPQYFQLKTRDGLAQLNGQIEFPSGDHTAPHPAVLIVPGGWFMDRDGYMGGTGTERDLIYRDLARNLVAVGLAVVRYDNRGVRCNEMTMPPCPECRPDQDAEVQRSKHYLKCCVDAEVRRTVSVQSQMDDVATAWSYVVRHDRVDTNRALIWAHSEGGLNAARLIGAGRIAPAGLICVGTATEDPAGLLRRQTIDRYAEHVMRWDSDGDGQVTDADIERELPEDELFATVGNAREVLTPSTDRWTLETLRDRFATEYEATKQAALAKPDDAPYPEPTLDFPLVAASNNWWKQWFTDTTPAIDQLAAYTGYASFHIGEIDSQFSAERQLSLAQSRIEAVRFARAPQLVWHPGRGHALRSGEPVVGPMDEEVKAQLVKEIADVLISGGSG